MCPISTKDGGGGVGHRSARADITILEVAQHVRDGQRARGRARALVPRNVSERQRRPARLMPLEPLVRTPPAALARLPRFPQGQGAPHARGGPERRGEARAPPRGGGGGLPALAPLLRPKWLQSPTRGGARGGAARHARRALRGPSAQEAPCGGGTRHVHLVRGEGQGVSS